MVRAAAVEDLLAIKSARAGPGRYTFPRQYRR
jgi:hypothetical protein